jgi:hypothetical protein
VVTAERERGYVPFRALCDGLRPVLNRRTRRGSAAIYSCMHAAMQNLRTQD